MAPPQHPNIRLATASPSTKPTLKQTLSHLSAIVRRAAANHADILLLPEAFLGGYPRGQGFGSVVGNRSASGRDDFLAYWDQCVDLGDVVGPGCAGGGDAWVKREYSRDGDDEDGIRRGDGTREELEKLARESGVFLVVGCVEKAGGSLYCACVYVCPEKGMIGKRRKVMPTGQERLIWAQAHPSSLRAVSTTIRGTRINLAAAICWENYMPLVRQTLYSQNINLYLAPTADGRNTWASLIRTIGIEGRCFVLSSNMCVRDSPSHTSTALPNLQEEQNEIEIDPKDTRSNPRRNSVVTQDGFEIALPSPERPSHRRKKSIIDEDGNEIVLCCPANENQIETSAVRQEIDGFPEGKKFSSRGGSLIVSPFGKVLAGPQWEDDEGILFADVDFRDCVRGRLDIDVGGSYSRNDSFKFSVDGLDLEPLPYE